MKLRHLSVSVANLVVVCLSILGGCASAPLDQETTPGRTAEVNKEQDVGEAALAKLAGRYGLVDDEESTAYLNKYLQTVALYTERQELTYRAAILNTEQVNAYALPGGYVLVTLGTLRRLETSGELAGVLAHELGHIQHKHILDNVNIEVEYSVLESLARILAGGRQFVNAAMAQISDAIEERLFYEGYQARDEYEADAYAVALLGSVGISSRNYREFLSRLSQESRSSEALDNLDATHPPLSERLTRIDHQMDDQEYQNLEVLGSSEAFTRFLERISSLEVHTSEEIN